MDWASTLETQRQAAEAMGKYHNYRVLERTRFEIANSGAAALNKA